MSATSSLSRRSFLKSSAAVGGGLVIGFWVPSMGRWAFAEGPASAGAGAAAPSGPAASAAPAATPPPVNAFLRIGDDETVTVLLSHSEMGQGIWTTLPMLVNEELDADWSRIRVEHAPAAPVYGHTQYHVQMTGGSTSTWSEFDRYRTIGAAARSMLVAAAAARWNVAPESCRTAAGFVVCGDRRASYGSLAAAAAQLPAPADVQLKPPERWQVIGKPMRRLDSPEKITGRARFGLDVRLPDMLTAVVAHPPTFGGTVASFDAAAAKAMPGVRAVYAVPSGVAVVADHFWAAKRGRDVLVVEWLPGPHADADSVRLRAAYRELARTAGAVAAQAGDPAWIEKVLAAVPAPATPPTAAGPAATPVAGAAPAAPLPPLSPIVAEYAVPYLAHAPMEPLNCTIRRTADGCEVWTGTQFQTGDQASVAKVLGLRPEQVKVFTTFLGGGFGRRANPLSDFTVEAAHVAKGVDRPVKVVWTREDDIRGGYYRPMAVHRMEAALAPSGAGPRPRAWRHRVVAQSILGGSPFAAMVQNGIDPTSVEGAADSPYLKSVSDYQVELHTVQPVVPVLWWRSVGHSHTAFAVESFVDELAAAAKEDPLEFRRALLAGAPRVQAVLELAAAKAGWDAPLRGRRARGIAVHESFGSVVCHVAQVTIQDGRIQVERVVTAIDCGICVNPMSVRAQMESGVAFGLGAALYGEVNLKDGRVVESNFHDYRILRLHEMPRVEVYIVDSREKSGGAGEPGTPPIAPAVANAVFALTGQRLRELPLRLA
jgi:isoquinoline 1-oxidoreductase subunit beta